LRLPAYSASAKVICFIGKLGGWGRGILPNQKVFFRVSLGISQHALDQANAGNAPAKLDGEQLERISIVLNLHAAMRTLFENPANVYGFMARPKVNPFFDGRAPLDVIAQGSMEDFVETYRRITSLCNGT
jgi:hypothetical protein